MKIKQAPMLPVFGRIQNAVVLALITAGIAMLLALSPVARMMEEELGLPWLFTLRSPLPLPPVSRSSASTVSPPGGWDCRHR